MWRTPIEPALAAGVWPFLSGGLTLLLGGPLLGLVLLVPGNLVPGTTSQVLIMGAFYLVWSPVLTVFALIGAIPMAMLCARIGWAGWGIALAGGILSGAIVGYMMDGPVILCPLLGLVFGALFWLHIRLAWPEAFGINVEPSKE